MDDGKCHLTWHSYLDHLQNMMKELMMNEDFADVTLVTEDKKCINANINILGLCSPVFKEILKKEKNSRTVMYLRGIQFTELESIIQFIYLGQATLNEERVNEFLAVGRSLEIKGLFDVESDTNASYNARTEPNYMPKDEHTINDTTEDTNVANSNVCVRIQKLKWANVHESVSTTNYKCEECHKKYPTSYTLKMHKQSVHQGVTYACDQCDFGLAYSSQKNLTRHIQSIHKGVRYSCEQCDFKAMQPSNLKFHVKSKHEGIRYAYNKNIKACVQCDYKTFKSWNLKVHIQSKHE